MQSVEKLGSDLLLMWFGTFRVASETEVRAFWVLWGSQHFLQGLLFIMFSSQESHVLTCLVY